MNPLSGDSAPSEALALPGFEPPQWTALGWLVWIVAVAYFVLFPLLLLYRSGRGGPAVADAGARAGGRSPAAAGGIRLLAWPFMEGRQLVSLPLLCAVLVSVPLFFSPGAMAGPDTFRTFDWLESAKLDAFSRQSLLAWGELPHWNPLLQGGFPQINHPSDSSLSPLLLPTLIFGEAVGMKLNVVLALALGALGVSLLGRDRLGLTPWYATFAGCAFALAGWVPARVAIGYYESAIYSAFPLIVWLLLESTGRPRRLFMACVLLALAAMHVHLGLPMLMLALMLMVLMELLRRGLPTSHLWRVALLCAGGAGLAAVKLLPMWTYLQQHGFRRQEDYFIFDAFYASLGQLWTRLIHVVPAAGVYDLRGICVQDDFGYLGLGLPLVLLAGAALLLHWALPRAQLVFAVLWFFFLLLCLGHNAPVDLFRGLWSLPLFHSMRGAVRYFSFGLMWFACVLAAGGLQLLGRSLPGVVRNPAVICLAVICLAWPAVQSASRNRTSFTRAIAPSPAETEKFSQEALRGTPEGLHLGGPAYDEGNLLIFRNLKAGIGTIYLPEDLPSRSSTQGRRIYDAASRRYITNPRYRGEAWCVNHDCQAEIIEVRANLIRVRARFQRPDELRVNQNAGSGWTLVSDDAGQWEGPLQREGLLSARYKGRGTVELAFRYEPDNSFWVGLSISLITLLMGLVWMVVRARSLQG